MPPTKELTLALRKRLIKFGAVAATLGVAALTAFAGAASAQVTTGITVTGTGTNSTGPTVQTSAVYATSGAMAYEGDAGVITVTIGANSTFKAGQPLRFEECNLDPSSSGACDGGTLQTSTPGSATPVIPNSDGSVTFTMDLWILPTGNAETAPDVDDPHNTNASGFDSGSTVTCDDGFDPSPAPGSFSPVTSPDPCSIWVGDDASAANWPSNSFVFNSITPLPNLAPLTPPATTTTTAATTTTTRATTTTTGATTTTSRVTTTTSAGTTTTQPSQGQVPESPSVPLLPLAALGLVGGAGFVAYRVRTRPHRA
jgi:hypothetical protein